MDRRVVIGGGVVAAALVVVGVRLAVNSGAKTGLDDALSHLPPGFTATHGAVTYSALTGEARVRDVAIFKDGVRLLAAGDVVVSGIGAQDESGTPKRIGEVVLHDAAAGPYRHIARIDLTGLSLATLRQVMDATAYPGGKPAWTDKRPILDHAEAHGIEGAQHRPGSGRVPPVDVTYTVASVTIDGVRLSQLASPPDFTLPAPVFAAAIEQNMAFASSEVHDVGFTATGMTTVHGHLGRGAHGSFDAGVISRFSIDDLTMSTEKPAGTIAVAGFSGHGFDISRLLQFMPVIVAEPGKPHPEIFGAMHLDGAELHGLSIDYPSGPLVTIDTMSGASGPASGASSFAMHALTVKTSGRPVKPGTRAALDQFGMADFTTDLTEAASYDPASGRLSIRQCDVDFHNLGTLHYTMDLTGVTRGTMQTPQQVQAAVLQARLVDASLKWDDGSLLGRLLKMAAAKRGLTIEQLRAGFAIPLASLPMLMPEQPDAAAQVTAFLDGQHSLSITLNPPAPVSLLQFQSTPPQERAALLGAHVSGS
jgi:hypothetical protein